MAMQIEIELQFGEVSAFDRLKYFIFPRLVNSWIIRPQVDLNH